MTTSTGEAVQFWVLGTVAVLGALGTVTMRKAVHSALCLAGTMIVLAVFYLAQGAYFLGVVQIVVYTGAVMMLFLFVVMLVGITAADSLRETIRGQRLATIAAGLGFGVLLVAGLANAHLSVFTGLGAANSGGNVEGLAALVFTRYVWAFEITGALLITAAVGAMVLTHREHTERPATQREMAERRVRDAIQVPPLPAPGVFARHNAVDIPGLLPDGSPAQLTVNATLRSRGQIRDVSGEHPMRVRRLEESADDYLDQRRPVHPDEPAANGPANGRSANRPAVNGDSANRPAVNGDSANGSANGRPANGPSANGPANGRSANGSAASGPSVNGPSSNGPSTNGPSEGAAQ